MKIDDLYSLFKKCSSVCTDTRNIMENSMFFSLKGANFNGNKFAFDSLNNGAAYAIVDEAAYQTDDRIILVDNVLIILQKLANYHRKQLNTTIIALTGSNGKTTTKELINVVLSNNFNATATKGNFNNHIGVPLTLLAMDLNTEIGIVEMGANHHKEIELLSEIASPDFGYITNFGSAHLEGFGSLEGVIEAKSELYDFLLANKKSIFINPNDVIQIDKTKYGNVIKFDESIKLISSKPFVKLSYLDIEIQSNLIGAYNYTNIAAAITIGQYFNVSKEKIKESIEAYKPDNNRSQIIKTSKNSIILDAYNANPTSMKEALKSFNLLDDKNKIVILGDMFELGTYSNEAHQKIVNYAEKLNFDKIILVGENFNKTVTNSIKVKNFDELKLFLNENRINNSSILIKGSRGMALERLVEFC